MHDTHKPKWERVCVCVCGGGTYTPKEAEEKTTTPKDPPKAHSWKNVGSEWTDRLGAELSQLHSLPFSPCPWTEMGTIHMTGI